MAKSTASKMASLVLRVFSLILLLIALIVICTNTKTIDDVKFRFQDVKAYRYMLSANVIGLAYTIFQLAFTIYAVINSNNEGNPLVEFYGDKIMSYLLATGSAAGFAATNDLKTLIDALLVDQSDVFKDFYAKGYASASLLLLAFVCTAALSVLSSFALPKSS